MSSDLATIYWVAAKAPVMVEAVTGLVAEKPVWIASMVRRREAEVEEALLESSSRSHRHFVPLVLLPIDSQYRSLSHMSSEEVAGSNELVVA